jgi:hypothetical protein
MAESKDLGSLLSEFIFPGVLLVGGIALLVSDSAVLSAATADLEMQYGQPVVAAFLLSLSYVLGYLSSEGGARLGESASKRIIRECITPRIHDLRLTPWGQQRGSNATISRNDFSYLRAGCRKSEGARRKINQHENALRVLRSAMISIPATLLLIQVYVVRNVQWRWFADTAFIVVPVVMAAMMAKAAFEQRLRAAVNSTVEHYLEANP